MLNNITIQNCENLKQDFSIVEYKFGFEFENLNLN